MSVRIPLRAGDGSIRAYATVDAEDADRVAGYTWRLHSRGYAKAMVKIDGAWAMVLLHRLILGLEHGDGDEADHISGDLLDNRRSNLRRVSHAQNMQNVRLRGRGTSRFRGVSWFAPGGKWRARVELAGRVHSLGYFFDEVAAAVAAEEFRAQHMPFAMPDPLLALHLDTVSITSTSIRSRGSDEEIAA